MKLLGVSRQRLSEANTISWSFSRLLELAVSSRRPSSSCLRCICLLFEGEKRTFFRFSRQIFLNYLKRCGQCYVVGKKFGIFRKLKQCYRAKKTIRPNNIVHDQPAAWSDTGILAWKLLQEEPFRIIKEDVLQKLNNFNPGLVSQRSWSTLT